MQKRKRKKKILGSKSIIYITTIAMLNFMGISYAVWNDGLRINTTVTTGNISPNYGELEMSDYRLSGNDRGELSIQMENDKEINITREKNRIFISGNIDEDYNDNLFFYVQNEGSIPIRLERINNYFEAFEDENAVTSVVDDIKDSGIIKQLQGPKNLIKENYKNSGQGQIHIQPNEPGTFKFEAELIFEQSTK